MKSPIKITVAGVLALATIGNASADPVGLPPTNSSSLILIVENAATWATYALNTGISLDSIFPTAGLVSGASLNTSLPGINVTISASPALQSFLLANPASGDLWTLTGGQYAGSGVSPSITVNSKAPGAAKAVFTSTIGTAAPSNLAQLQLANLERYENTLTGSFGTFGPLAALTTSTETATAMATQDLNQQFDLWASNDLAALGSTAVQLFGLTGNGVVGTVQSYSFGTAALDTQGNLTMTGNVPPQPPAIPLPATIWLLGSALLGGRFLSRRS